MPSFLSALWRAISEYFAQKMGRASRHYNETAATLYGLHLYKLIETRWLHPELWSMLHTTVTIQLLIVLYGVTRR